MTTQARSRYQQGRTQSPDNMPEQAWEDSALTPANQGIAEQPAAVAPVQQPYNIFRNVQLPNVTVGGTNRMNIGSVVPSNGVPNANVGNIPLNPPTPQGAPVVPQVGEPDANVRKLSTWETMPQRQMWDTSAGQPIEGEAQQAQPTQPNQQMPQTPQNNVQGVSVVPPIQEPTGNEKAPYIDTFNQLQEEKKKAVPTSKDGGKGLTNWIKNNFGGDGTKEGNRRAIQNIMALGNMLRHAANLRGVVHEATPQQIADQNAINDAQWKQEDALEQAQAEKQREFERKLAKDKADAARADRDFNFKVYQQQQKDKDADRNYGLKRDAEGRAKEKHSYELAEKAAGIANKEAQRKKLEEETKWIAPTKQADINAKKASAANSYASAAKHRASTLKTLKDLQDNNVHSFTSGWYGTLNRDKKSTPLSQDEVVSIYNYAVKQKWMGKVSQSSTSYSEPSIKDMLAAISDAVGGNDGKAQHLAHYLVNNYHFKLDDSSKSNAYNNVQMKYDEQREAKQRMAYKKSTGSDFGGITIKK